MNLPKRPRFCPVCGKIADKYKYCSIACKKSRRTTRKEWIEIRKQILIEEDFTCRSCHKKLEETELEIDHIIEIADGGDKQDRKNLEVLCKYCHKWKTKIAAGLRVKKSKKRKYV